MFNYRRTGRKWNIAPVSSWKGKKKLCFTGKRERHIFSPREGRCITFAIGFAAIIPFCHLLINNFLFQPNQENFGSVIRSQTSFSTLNISFAWNSFILHTVIIIIQLSQANHSYGYVCTDSCKQHFFYLFIKSFQYISKDSSLFTA